MYLVYLKFWKCEQISKCWYIGFNLVDGISLYLMTWQVFINTCIRCIKYPSTAWGQWGGSVRGVLATCSFYNFQPCSLPKAGKSSKVQIQIQIRSHFQIQIQIAGKYWYNIYACSLYHFYRTFWKMLSQGFHHIYMTLLSHFLFTGTCLLLQDYPYQSLNMHWADPMRLTDKRYSNKPLSMQSPRLNTCWT